MAGLLIEARDAAAAARDAGQAALDAAVLDDLVTRYRKLDALRDLFNGHAWLPPALEPA